MVDLRLAMASHPRPLGEAHLAIGKSSSLVTLKLRRGVRLRGNVLLVDPVGVAAEHGRSRYWSVQSFAPAVPLRLDAVRVYRAVPTTTSARRLDVQDDEEDVRVDGARQEVQRVADANTGPARGAGGRARGLARAVHFRCCCCIAPAPAICLPELAL